MALPPGAYTAWVCNECGVAAVLEESSEAVPLRAGGLGAECNCGMTQIRLRADGLRDVITPSVYRERERIEL